MSTASDGRLLCDGAVYFDGQYTGGQCEGTVTHMDNKGWVYCTSHGISRRSQRPCRKLRSHELNKLKRGEALARY